MTPTPHPETSQACLNAYALKQDPSDSGIGNDAACPSNMARSRIGSPVSTACGKILRGGALGMTLLLAACGGAGPWMGGSNYTPPSTQVEVTTDRVVITGPNGYCVDDSSTRDRGTTAFVLLGNCAAIAHRRSAGQPRQLGVLTASVSDSMPDQSLRESIPDLDGFFRSDRGRELLSRAGDASTVTIEDDFHQEDVFFLRATDTSDSPIDGVETAYWRSYFDVGNRVVTLSVLGLDSQPLSSEDGLALLRDYTQAVRDANASAASQAGAAAAPATAATAATATQTQTPPSTAQTQASTVAQTPASSFWSIGLFRRIMR